MTRKSTTLRIAIFSGELPSTTFIERLITGVAKKHTVLLFGVKRTKTSYAYMGNVKTYSTPKNKLSNLCVSTYRCIKLGLRSPRDLKKLGQEVKRFRSSYDRWIWFTKFLPIVLYRPDVLHLQWTRDLEFYTFFKTTFQIPLMVSFRGAHINYTPIVEPKIGDIYKKTFPKVDGFHAVSQAIVKEALKYGDIESRTTVIHSPVPGYFLDNYSQIKTEKKSKTLKVVSVGRVHWKKGYSYALKTISILKTKGYDIHYTLVGPSEPNEELLYLMNDLGLKDHIHFKGSLSQKELIPFLQTQDILVLPSVEEGIANVVLEAMALGLPVVSTDCGGMSEVVQHKKTGWLVPLRDPNAMADAIVEIVESDEASLERMTKEAHNLVKKKFDYNLSIHQFIGLYESVSLNSNSKK